MLNYSLQIYILIGFITLIVFVLVWCLLYFMFRVPNDDREHYDDPPIFYKAFSFFINVIAFYVSPYVNEQTYERYEKKIIHAGVEYQFKPSHIIASKIFSCFFLTFFAILVLYLFNQNLILVFLVSIFGYMYPDLWLKEIKKKRNNKISKDMPFFLDMITLSVESGLNLNGAIRQAVDKSPNGPVRSEFEKVVRDIKTGVSRSEAFRKMSARVDDQSVKSLVSSIIQAEKMGMNLGPILRSQAEQRRIERFQKAEKMAMEAPVKLLFPLVAFIFPCTFIVIGFPVYVMMKDAFL
ncbi:type II secretion system F family protein [Psychrobacter lutiphocae]|uniref:type II secretion system F family protein n=1 Tax=Psychrobacter lutiphocae TaxID=540500 RepID=UPI00036AD0B1|nr:type II secretion system F family protein [Psychrobacter lutiphocae]